MTAIDQRRLRVGIEVAGRVAWYEGLAITVKATKGTSDTDNTADVGITNLSRDVRNRILTETSPFNSDRKAKRVYVEAGRASTGVSRLFEGDVTAAEPTQPPDIGLTLSVQTGAWSRGTVVARSGQANEPLRDIAGRVADDLGLDLIFEATDKLIANWSFSGAALRQIRALAQTGRVDVYQDDDKLVVKDYNKALANRSVKVSAGTGMVGVPKVTERGVSVQMLFDPNVTLGTRLDLTSQLNPSLDGGYTVYSLSYDLASRETPWYVTAEATRD